MLRIFTNATYATKKFDMRSEGLHPQRLEVDVSFGSKEVNESKPINLRGDDTRSTILGHTFPSQYEKMTQRPCKMKCANTFDDVQP